MHIFFALTCNEHSDTVPKTTSKNCTFSESWEISIHQISVASLQVSSCSLLIVLMRLNYNLGKVNLETMCAAQQLSPRHAGLCGVAMLSSRADKCLYISALLCFALLCDRCGSLQFMDCDICWFWSHSSLPLDRYSVSMGCDKYSTEFFFSVMMLGGWRSLGCHGHLQGKAPLLRYRPFHL